MGRQTSTLGSSSWKGDFNDFQSSSQPFDSGSLFVIPFPALVLAKTHIIRLLSVLCESLTEQAVALPCHKIVFPLWTQESAVNTENPAMLSSCQQSQNLKEKESKEGEERGVFPYPSHKRLLWAGLIHSIWLMKHSTLYLLWLLKRQSRDL